MAKKIMSLSVKIIGLVILALIVSPASAVTCQDAIVHLIPCQAYLVGSGALPSPQCCMGAQDLYKMASTTEIRRTLCQCFQDALKKFGINIGKAQQLGTICKLGDMPTFTPNVDCQSVK